MKISEADLQDAQAVLDSPMSELSVEETQLLQAYIEAGRTREPFHDGLGSHARHIIQMQLARLDA